MFEFDGFNRMSGMETGGISAEYEYDSSGLRTSKTVNGERTEFVLDGIYVIAEINADGDVTNYIRGLTGIIYRETPDNVKTYYVANNHGDVTKLVNSSGQIIESYTYDEFGNELNIDSTDDNPFRYCGEYYDSESGLIYLRARYYDPTIGRFISEDTAMDDLNWYVYCASNPINFWDPTGNYTEEELEMYQNGELSYEQWKILLDLTNDWRNATTYAAKDEIHNKAELFRNNGYKIIDKTVEADEQLRLNGMAVYKSSNKNAVVTGAFWYTLVDNEGYWDYKTQPADWMPGEGYFMYNGEMLTLADYGNLNYGYTGTALGIIEKDLYEAGGYLNPTPTQYERIYFYSDTEVDHYWIERGIKMARKDGYISWLNLPLDIIF